MNDWIICDYCGKVIDYILENDDGDWLCQECFEQEQKEQAA